VELLIVERNPRNIYDEHRHHLVFTSWLNKGELRGESCLSAGISRGTRRPRNRAAADGLKTGRQDRQKLKSCKSPYLCIILEIIVSLSYSTDRHCLIS